METVKVTYQQFITLVKENPKLKVSKLPWLIYPSGTVYVLYYGHYIMETSSLKDEEAQIVENSLAGITTFLTPEYGTSIEEEPLIKYLGSDIIENIELPIMLTLPENAVGAMIQIQNNAARMTFGTNLDLALGRGYFLLKNDIIYIGKTPQTLKGDVEELTLFRIKADDFVLPTQIEITYYKEI